MLLVQFFEIEFKIHTGKFYFSRCNSRCLTTDKNGDAQTKTARGPSTDSSNAEADRDLGKRS